MAISSFKYKFPKVISLKLSPRPSSPLPPDGNHSRVCFPEKGDLYNISSLVPTKQGLDGEINSVCE